MQIETIISFICGVLETYLPDLSLLEGVVFVDLDQNVVKYHSSDPVPKFSRISSNRDINKLVSNPKKPLNANVKINEKEVRNAFVSFFAKFLKSYKICMNPSTGPSKDKFNKEKWLKPFGVTDKVFLDLFIEAQLFQCFIDERFDASLTANSHEVLYFDEKIDETIHNKSTPFLLDTTFLHKKNDNYRVPIPSAWPSPIEYANGFPLVLDVSILKEIDLSPAPLLVSENDLSQQPWMHISWMSVEFFKQKQLYDRHWHSLEARINSQNIMFRQILQFFMKWQDSNNKYVSDLMRINKSISTSIQNTDISKQIQRSSFDEPWFEFKKYVEMYCTESRRVFDECKKKSFIPIMESVGSKENELMVLIESARRCESMTAKTKCEVELANKNLSKYTSVCSFIFSTSITSKLLPPNSVRLENC